MMWTLALVPTLLYGAIQVVGYVPSKPNRGRSYREKRRMVSQVHFDVKSCTPSRRPQQHRQGSSLPILSALRSPSSTSTPLVVDLAYIFKVPFFDNSSSIFRFATFNALNRITHDYIERSPLF